jgi:hypothetical protein
MARTKSKRVSKGRQKRAGLSLTRRITGKPLSRSRPAQGSGMLPTPSPAAPRGKMLTAPIQDSGWGTTYVECPHDDCFRSADDVCRGDVIPCRCGKEYKVI